MRLSTMCLRALLVLSAACNSDNGTKPAPPDTSPPAQIQNLAVVYSPDRVVTLVWSAPGDDGSSGQAGRYDIRRSATTITEATWGSATPVANPPAPKPAGGQERLDLPSLPLGTWYFAVKSADEIPNWSALSNVATATLEDQTAPAQVTDLSVTAVTRESVTLAWTAPGDDGVAGRAAEYDLRCAVSPISDDVLFGAATRVQQVPAPDSAGTAQTFTVTSRETGTTLYFAIKTADVAHNWSPLSNPASGTPHDAIAPGVVSDLGATAATAQSVTLSWTAPGNDGTTGQAAIYELRYSGELITEATWGSAQTVPGLPAPAAGGSTESFTVTGLQSGQTYYFYLKTIDEAENASALSNPLGIIPDTVPARRVTYSGTTFGASSAAWSPDGTLIAYQASSGSGGSMSLFTIPAEGSHVTRLTNTVGFDGAPTWSPDGLKIAFRSNRSLKYEIWSMDALAGAEPVQLTLDEGTNCGDPAWSPDGTRIAYTITTLSGAWIWAIAVTGGEPEEIASDASQNFEGAWSPDGTRMAFTSNRNLNADIWVIPVAGGDSVRLTDDPGADAHPAWSPDGSQIAFHSDRTGNNEIWVMSSTGGSERQLTNHADSDIQAAWSPDGRRIAFTRKHGSTDEIWVLMMP